MYMNFSVFLQFSFYSSYLIKNQKTGVIIENCLLMDQPSAGAKLQKKIKKGHQVILLDDLDIWYKIELEDKFYYIRKTNLILI